MIPNSGTKYLKAADCATDEVVMFVDEGTEVESTFCYPELTLAGKPHPMAGKKKTQLNMTVQIWGDNRILTLNKTSYKNLAPTLGLDTKDWINKQAKITLMMTPNGKQAIILQPL